MKNKSLVLCTYQFPYGKGETFLESEITYLAEGFEKVWIIPSRLAFSKKWQKETDLACRELPKNCIIIKPDKKFSPYKFFKYLLYIIQIKANKKNFRRYTQDSIKIVLFLTKFHRFFKNLEQPCLGYSYWKGESTVGLLVFKKKGFMQHVVSRAHGSDLYQINYPFEGYIKKNSNYIIPISQNGYDYLSNLGYQKNNILINRLGVNDTDTICKPSKDSILRIVSCSSIIKLKRVTLLAEALSLLNIKLKWTHFGDGEEFENVEEIVKNKFKNAKADFKGFVSNTAVLEYYKNNPIDFFVNVSSREGLPVSIMEAMIHGIPCIATDVGGTSELVNDSVGRLVKANISASELASVILTECQNKNSSNEKRIAARKQALEKVNASKNYTGFVKFLKTI